MWLEGEKYRIVQRTAGYSPFFFGSLWFSDINTLCHNAAHLKFCHIPLVSLPFTLLSFIAVPSSVSASHSLYQTALMLMSLKPQVLLVPLEVWHQSLPPPPLGPIFPVWSFKVLSWVLCLATTECECVSDRMVMSIPEIEPQSFPLFLKIDLFSRAK